MDGSSWEDGGGFDAVPPLVDTSYDQPRNSDTVTRDIVTQRQDIGTSTNDQWGGFFKTAVGNVLDYGLKKDAALTGVQIQRQQTYANYGYGPQNRQTLNGRPGQSGNLTSNHIFMIAAVVAVIVLKK